MAAHPATTFIVATDRDAMVLEKLATIEQALEGLVPLLEKIITHLETPKVPQMTQVAPYAALYDLPEAGPPEGTLVAQALAPPPTWSWWMRAFIRRSPR